MNRVSELSGYDMATVKKRYPVLKGLKEEVNKLKNSVLI